MTKFVNAAVMNVADLKRGSARKLLSTTLGVCSFLLAGQNALAGAWYASNINGPEPLIPQSEVPTGGSGVTLYALGLSGTIYEVLYTSGAWYFNPIYSDANARALTVSAAYLPNPAIPALNVYYVAHSDSDGNVRLTSCSIINGCQTQFVDTGTGLTFATVSTLVTHNGTLHIFYTSYSGGHDLLKVATYDGKFSIQTLDGNGGSNGRVMGDMIQPTAVELSGAWEGLEVYYFDQASGRLRWALSPNTIDWTEFKTLDGPGGLSGDTAADVVGYSPSAIVYNIGPTSVNTVNIFYTDLTQYKLRIAQGYPVPGYGWVWNFGWVGYIDIQSAIAPVIHGSEMQVYFENQGQLNVAYGTGPGALSLAALDGPDSCTSFNPICCAHGDLLDLMGPYVTAVETNGNAPSVFYLDMFTATLRNCHWKP